jgi:uncharacterized protein (DUF3820 family)
MPFGAHRGKRLIDVPASYLLWLVRQPWLDKWPALRAYITNNEQRMWQLFGMERMAFGKYKDTALCDVPASYLLWLYEQDWLESHNPVLHTWIWDNIDDLKDKAGTEQAGSWDAWGPGPDDLLV